MTLQNPSIDEIIQLKKKEEKGKKYCKEIKKRI